MRLDTALEENPQWLERCAAARRDPDQPAPILTCKIKLTWRCNLRCPFCSVWRKADGREGPVDLPAEVVRKTLSRLAEDGLRKVHFSGGEVLLRKDFFELVDHARALGLQVNLTTNGTLIDKEMARRMVRSKVHSVAISIDGATAKAHDAARGEGAWRKTWRGIDRLREKRGERRRPLLAVNTLITRRTIASLGELYDRLKANGVERWRLLPVDTLDKASRPTDEQWRELAKRWDRWSDLMTRHPINWSTGRDARRAASGKYAGVFYGENICYAPWLNLFIDADGLVYPCCMGKRDMRPFGNVNHEPIERVLSGERRRETLCTIAAGKMYPVCDRCDDYLEENRKIGELIKEMEP